MLSDLEGGARLAVERLVQRGCRHLAMIASSLTPPDQRRRHDAFVDSLPDGMATMVEPTSRGGRVAMAKLLEREPAIDGVFAYNDMLAIGAMQAIRASGRSVPDDIAVIGCDDIAIGEVVTPTLTTIRIDRERLGRTAVQLLCDLAAGDLAESSVVLPVELVVRDSG